MYRKMQSKRLIDEDKKSLPLSTKPIHAGKKWLRELIWAYLTEGAPKKIVWGINLGIGS